MMEKFRGLSGIVLRLDALTPRSNVSIKASDGFFVDCPASLSLRTVHNLTYTRDDYPIPKAIEVTWRDDATRYQGQCKYKNDKVLGTATVPVADRIPDAVLDEIRINGGTLRIKIRLVDDGVLIGWDIERIITKENWRPGMYGVIDYPMAGGDFKERRRDENGKYTGWYIDKNGRKIETDY